MIIGSHNSWSYLPPKKWWMRPFRFMAKCQDWDIMTQYISGVRCFDLRIRFETDYEVIVAHGFMEYKINSKQLHADLDWLNKKGDVYIRIAHEVRNSSQYTPLSIKLFQHFCEYCKLTYNKTKFWYGRNFYNNLEDFNFKLYPSCKERHASVCSSEIIDMIYPRHYAKKHNKSIIEQGTEKEILLIDFINYN